METKAGLTGEQADLLILADLFREGEPHVVADDDKWYMVSSQFEGIIEDPSRLYGIAQALLRRMNGVARAFHSTFKPVGLTGSFRDTSGRQSVSVQLTTAIARVYIPGSASSSVPRDCIRISKDNDDLSDVLRLMGTRDGALDWGDLYKIHEIVIKNTHGKSVISEHKWGNRFKRFTMSANNPKVSGDDARHARMEGEPPKHPMDLTEARTAISELVAEWIKHLLAA